MAAFPQSTLPSGAVQAGSAFALAQSAAMGGIAVPAIGAQAAGASAAAAGIIGSNVAAGLPPSTSRSDEEKFVPSRALVEKLLGRMSSKATEQPTEIGFSAPGSNLVA